MLALSVSFAFPIQAAEPRTGQGKAVAKVNKLGGRVTIDEKDPDKPVIGIDLTATLITDAGLDGLKALTRLQRLALGGTRVTDTRLERLKTFARLRKLDLRDTRITDAGWRTSRRDRLAELRLSGTGVTDAGLEHARSA